MHHGRTMNQKSFRTEPPSLFPQRRSVTNGFRAKPWRLFASKTVPAVSGSPFSVGASAHSIFKIAALSMTAAMGAGAHVQELFPTPGLVSTVHCATLGIIPCRPPTTFCWVPLMVCLILSRLECLVKLSLILSSPLIFRTFTFPLAT